MGQFTKTTVASGQTITSTWGNDVQTQFEKVVGLVNNEITEIKAVLRDVDTRNLLINRVNGKISTMAIRDSTADVLVYTINRGTDGKISTIVETIGGGGGKTVTYTLNRTDGLITSVTKTVV